MESGILLLDKPAGLTSFQVVRRARRALGVRKIGHLGTLDPFATGLLPLCVQEATKLVPFLLPEPKTYRAHIKLGEETDTQDLTGEVVARSGHRPTAEEVRQAAARFVGEIEQVPPLYSALHHQGERLYRLARRGETVELQPRKVRVYCLEVEAVAGDAVTLTVTCSHGTYVRTLAADLGQHLGCGAHLAALRRLAVGPFRVEEAIPVAALAETGPEELRNRIIPLADCLPGMREVGVSADQASLLRQGRTLTFSGGDFTAGEQVRILRARELVAVARVGGAPGRPWLAPVRVFSGSQTPTAR
jgi:tRNA pseudouridine55 synthase